MCSSDLVVMRVSALKKDGSLEFIADYTVHEEGWEAAIDLAEDHKTMRRNDYDRVVVDMYADWNAVNGEFTEHWLNGDGFNWDAILVPADVRVTLNLNEYTINRGLTEYELNGEVMFIDEDADVIINNGTVTGGWSYNGAGGIHVDDGANVTLNNVHVVGNTVTNDQGAAIALYDGSTLTMNDGSLSNNVLNYLADHYEAPCSGVPAMTRTSAPTEILAPICTSWKKLQNNPKGRGKPLPFSLRQKFFLQLQGNCTILYRHNASEIMPV